VSLEVRKNWTDTKNEIELPPKFIFNLSVKPKCQVKQPV
jgi:hypothetical protein